VKYSPLQYTPKERYPIKMTQSHNPFNLFGNRFIALTRWRNQF